MAQFPEGFVPNASQEDFPEGFVPSSTIRTEEPSTGVPEGFKPKVASEVEDPGFTLGGEIPPREETITDRLAAFGVSDPGGINTKPADYLRKIQADEVARAQATASDNDKGFFEKILPAPGFQSPFTALSDESRPEGVPSAIEGVEGAIEMVDLPMRTLRTATTGVPTEPEPSAAGLATDVIGDLLMTGGVGGLIKRGAKTGGKELLEEIITKQADEVIPPPKFNTLEDLRGFAEQSRGLENVEAKFPQAPTRLTRPQGVNTLDPLDQVPESFRVKPKTDTSDMLDPLPAQHVPVHDDALPLIEEVVPVGAIQKIKNFVSNPRAIVREIRRSDNALRAGGAEGVVDPIVATRGKSLEFFAEYNDIRKDILKDITPGSETSKVVSRILDRQISGVQAQVLIGSKEAQKAITAANRMRNEFFDPAFELLQSPELAGIVGDVPYTQGYLPIFKERLRKSALDAAEQQAMLDNLTAEHLAPSITKLRKAGAKAFNVELDIHTVATRYQKGISKAIYDLPAYDEAIKVANAMEEGPMRELAIWYSDNFIGHPKLAPGETRQIFDSYSNWLADRQYDALIGLNWQTGFINLSQTVLNTYPKIGSSALRGMKDLTSAEGQRVLHKSGVLLDRPGVERSLAAAGGLKHSADKMLYMFMDGSEYFNRGTAYLGGLRKAAKEGLAPGAKTLEEIATHQKAKDFAMEVVGDTQFFYDKVSPLPFQTKFGRAATQFTSYPVRQAEFVSTSLANGYRGFKAGGKRTAKQSRDMHQAKRLILMWGTVVAAMPEGTVDRMLNFATDFTSPSAQLIGRITPLLLKIAGGALTGDVKQTFEGTDEAFWGFLAEAIDLTPGKKPRQALDLTSEGLGVKE